MTFAEKQEVVSAGEVQGYFVKPQRTPLECTLSPLETISLAAGFALLAEASLSFVGLGVQLPNASWGLMLGRGYIEFREALPDS